MAQPQNYSPSTDFSDLGAINLSKLDTELVAISTSVNQIRGNLAILQRDDTKLANNAVHPQSLSSDTLKTLGINTIWPFKGDYLVGTNYKTNDIFANTLDGERVLYFVTQDFTASSFATEAGFFVLLSSRINSDVSASVGSYEDLTTAFLNYIQGLTSDALALLLGKTVYVNRYGASDEDFGVNWKLASAVSSGGTVGRQSNGTYITTVSGGQLILTPVIEEEVRPEYWGGSSNGTTDSTSAIQIAHKFALDNYGKVLLNAGTYKVSSVLDWDSRVALIGAGGNVKRTNITSHSTSGHVIRVTGRSCHLEGINVTSDSVRGSIALDAFGKCGIVIGKTDGGSDDLPSRTQLKDVHVEAQPGSGIVIIGSAELADCNRVTAYMNRGNGFVLDDGTLSGYTNKYIATFSAKFDGIRALENGLRGLVVGSSTQTNRALHLAFNQLECLGNCWNRAGISGGDHQAEFYAGGIVVSNPDFEDQQYADATTYNGVTRSSNATPAAGWLAASSILRFIGGHYSALSQSGKSNPSTNSIYVEDPTVFVGAYSTVQPLAFDLSGSIDVYSKGRTQTGATQLFKISDTISKYILDGNEYVGTTLSAIPAGLYNGLLPVTDFTITSGTLTIGALNGYVRGQGAVADSLFTIRTAIGFAGHKGMVLTLWWNGEDIAINNGASIITSTGGTVNLTTTLGFVRFKCNGTAWVQI